MAFSYLRNPSIERLPVIMEWLRSGDLRIPPFQREIVWSSEQRLSLCDTIRRGLPAGSLMVWRTTRSIDPKGFRGAFDLDLPTLGANAAQQYLLDGLQRMTTVFAALGPALWTRNGETVPWRTKLAPDGTPWAIGFDVDVEPDEGNFELLDPEGTKSTVLPLDVLLDDEAYDEWRGGSGLEREHKNRARAIRTAFVDYLIPVVPLATDELGPVTLTFKRINDGGTKMSAFDMHRALTWRDDFDLERVLDEQVRPRLEPLGWAELSKDDLLRVIATTYGMAPVEIPVEKLCDQILEDPSRMDTVPDSIVWAIDVLRELGFAGPATLPYTYALVFAARCWQENNKQPLVSEKRRLLIRWLVDTVITERFSSCPPHIIRAAWTELKDGLSDKTPRRSPRAIKVRASGRVNFGWARPVITAAVLALQSPRYADGQVMEDAPRRLGEMQRAWFPKLLTSAQVGAMNRETSPREVHLTAANHVVCDTIHLEDLRNRLRDPECPENILESHAISSEAHALLIADDSASFLEARFRTIIERENTWLRSHGSKLKVPVP